VQYRDLPLLQQRAQRKITSMVQPVISRDPDVMGGTPVFVGTRVPVQTLLDYLEAGDSIDEFLQGFPSVSREQVIAFLEQAKDRLIESVS
jgi:uncharacterized protein (DUF433 family)